MKIKFTILVTLLFSLAIIGCGTKETDHNLHILAWSEYVPQEIIDLFTKETGIPVLLQTASSNEDMLAQMNTATERPFDLIQPSDYTVQRLIKEGQLVPLDHSQIPNLKYIGEEFRNMPFDPGNKFSVPWMAGFIGIVYNAEIVPGPVVGYRDVFIPEFKNRIVIIDDAREITSWALSAAGIPINDASPENLETIKPLLRNWLSKVNMFDSRAPRIPMLEGDADMAVVWSGEGAKLFEENPKFQWVMPAEGVHMFVDNLAIPKNAVNKTKAEKFINFILRPEISKMISDAFPYYNPNFEARKLLTPEQLNNPASYPASFDMSRAELFIDIGERENAIEAVVKEAKTP